MNNVCDNCKHGKEYHGVRGTQCKFIIATTSYDVNEPMDIICRCIKFVEKK